MTRLLYRSKSQSIRCQGLVRILLCVGVSTELISSNKPTALFDLWFTLEHSYHTYKVPS